ncbi:MAG: universal stress protein [Pseudomonadales bacterium]|nr:universal stress protein [Pseudomonadales bacterium]
MPNILVVIDPEEAEHHGLRRIREVPQTDISFKVDLYIENAASAKKAESFIDELEKKNQWLKALVQPLQQEGYNIVTEVIAFDRLYESIIQSAHRFKADFVFKPLRQHGALSRALFTSTDWNLIRFCPSPLLLVSHNDSVRGKPVIAAVDVASRDEAHEELNRIVLEEARVFASVLGSEIHLVNAYSIAAVAGTGAVSDPLAYQISRDKHDEQLKEAIEFAGGYGIAPEAVHLREGAADLVVNEYATEVDAGVIVLGTVARSGI